MTDNEPDNLTLRMLRKMDAKLDTISRDVRDVKFRVGHLESGFSYLSNRLDDFDDRLVQIEKRLGLVEA